MPGVRSGTVFTVTFGRDETESAKIQTWKGFAKGYCFKQSSMSHSGPFRCQCGQIHGNIFDGVTNDLLPFIDTAGRHIRPRASSLPRELC